MKKKAETITIRQFKDGSQNFWLISKTGKKHYSIIDGKAVLCAGGREVSEETEKLKKKLKLS